jgi:hypothetical protein
MIKVEAVNAEGPSAEEDLAWNSFVDIVLMPNERLPQAHQQAIALDYGMVDGRATLTCRQAMVFYVLQHLGLLEDQNPAGRQLLVQNMADLGPFTKARQS